MPRALVTGASAGLGAEFALQLAVRGYALTLVARREDRLRELLGLLAGNGHDYIAADLGSTEGCEQVARRLTSESYDLLINNAGYSSFEPFHSDSWRSQHAMLAVNCGALLHLAHSFLAGARPGDALVNLASVVAFLPTPAQPVYSASKAFVASLSECLWHEQRERGVYVMGLCPGVTRTEFIATASGGEANDEALPSLMVQDAEEVVAEALRALDQRKRPLVVTGRANRMMLALVPRVFSRFGLLRLLARVGDPKRALGP